MYVLTVTVSCSGFLVITVNYLRIGPTKSTKSAHLVLNIKSNCKVQMLFFRSIIAMMIPSPDKHTVNLNKKIPIKKCN